MTVRLIHADCLEAMRGLPDASVDSVVTDPPYHLTHEPPHVPSGGFGNPRSKEKQASRAGFMGKSWDGGDIAFRVELWAECFRLLKPGGHLVAFSGSRTYHRMACAIEDAGFEIRDQLSWIFGSGFPKHRNALKPAHEPICLARKPLIGTVAANVAAHGTGAINIDGCRVPGASDGGHWTHKREIGGKGIYGGGGRQEIDFGGENPHAAGRWPANVCHDGSDEVLEAFARFGESKDGVAVKRNADGGPKRNEIYGTYGNPSAPDVTYGGAGTAARFFFSAKSSREEREIGHITGERNTHPTVKPLDLMQWLCRLVTPPGGTVLDPFLGSGSTAIAADREGFSCIGIEQSGEYVEIARRRVAGDAGLFAEFAA